MKANDATKIALIKDFEKVLDLGLFDNAAKLGGADDGVDAELVKYINEKIEARKNAKANKNYAEADAIRQELLEKGITLIDTKDGTKFTVN
jgi:cysteinyl-tRNA synthetase